MINSMLKSLLALLVCARIVSAQEGVGTASVLERLAVRAALEHAGAWVTPGLRVVIDPMIVEANQAPPTYRGSRTRDSSRNRYLTEAFHASSLRHDSVVDCSARPCRMHDADVLVTLSEPAIVGDKATVTVTTVLPVHGTSDRRVPITTYYKTTNVRLEKRGASWQVVGLDDLGMS
ncbi:MAG TPA: hypothetical protein VGJ18_16890 [Gemmatimonadaceae bacterium]